MTSVKTFGAGFVAGAAVMFGLQLALAVRYAGHVEEDRHVEPAPAVSSLPQPQPAPLSPYRTTASELTTAYYRNEVATDAAIGGRPIEVVGIVHSVDKDGTSVVIRLNSSRAYTHPAMKLLPSETRTASTLDPGDSVTMLCASMRRAIDTPVGSACAIQDLKRAASGSVVEDTSDPR